MCVCMCVCARARVTIVYKMCVSQQITQHTTHTGVVGQSAIVTAVGYAAV